MGVAAGGLRHQVEAHHPAHAEGNDGHPRIVQRPVGGDDEVGLQPVSMLGHELGDVRAADLLLALQEHDDVARQLAGDGKMRLDRHQLGEVLALVVADAAGIDPPVADGRLERRAQPRFIRLGRLHVVVAIEQHGGLGGVRTAPAQHHRVVLGGDRLNVHAQRPQHADEKLRDLGDPLVLRADGRVADVVHQPFDEALAVRIDVREDAVQGVGAHAGSPERVRRMAPAAWTRPLQPGGTRVVVSNWLTIAGPSKVAPAPRPARS